jgi:hypothetical protein
MKSSGSCSGCQEGHEMRSLEDLIDCQEGREEIPYCQVGKGEQMRLSESLMNSEVSSDQREELTEKMNSEVSSYQRGELMEKEDQKSILMIGGIEIFLPLRSVEVRACVAEGATEEGQPTETVMGEEWSRC